MRTENSARGVPFCAGIELLDHIEHVIPGVPEIVPEDHVPPAVGQGRLPCALGAETGEMPRLLERPMLAVGRQVGCVA